MEAASNYFALGHRTRLEISSSNFSRFDRKLANLNTDGNNYDETDCIGARTAVHHSREICAARRPARDPAIRRTTF